MKENTVSPNRSSILASHLGWVCLVVLVGLLWLPEGKALWTTWNGDETLSHGPLIPLIAAALLFMRRGKIGLFTTSSLAGGFWLLISALCYVGSVWADVAFIRLLCLILMLAGVFLFLGGWKTLQAVAGALGLLIFMIPWPMTFVEHLAFPLQITSSSYAALLAGLCGVPVVRDGVYLSVVPDPTAKPIYSMIVAQRCSGLTSLTVLLTLAYIVAYFTPLKPVWRMLLVALVVPLTLFTNSLRLTIILLAGNYHSPAMASWVHDHETPVLIGLCSTALMGLRHAMLAWTQREPEKEGGTLVTIPSAHTELDTAVGRAGQLPSATQ